SADGQLWGNPLYAWEKHEATGYHWWIKRIAHTLSGVDLLRIDHFRGFESYWAVPFGEKTAVGGVWRKGPGKKLFDEIKKALGDLPIIAEDLGIITEEVEALRDELGFPGMKVLQFGMDALPENTHMPHNMQTPDVVLYTGTHDNDTTAGWYAAANGAIRNQARRYMNTSGEDIAWDFIRLAFLSVAAFAVIPIQDVMSLGAESRMNRPGTALGNWQFRYTEDMLKDDLAAGLFYLSDLSDRNRPAPKTEPE
ncbi:MAG: 4-alpha-glucanotransferase, partial [Clostridiales bacterium]|nr:4-alpha-glucanotransferase [Clostridiales bacterium]